MPPVPPAQPTASLVIDVGTTRARYHLMVEADGRLYNARFGSLPIPRQATEGSGGDSLTEAYPTSGTRYVFEPALRVIHADGNTSTDLVFADHRATEADGVRETRLRLRDPAYPLEVELVFRAHLETDVIEQWADIRHTEERPVLLERFASAAPQITGEAWLTHYHGDWINEMNPVTERLTPGMKVIDSKLVVRAARFAPPLFHLSIGEPATENWGEVWGGMLDWSGSFQFAFDHNGLGQIRLLAGLNPLGSAYRLEPGVVFRTPLMRWAWSGTGLGELSRKLHRWARRHGLRDGHKPRSIPLNNWEATYFDFDEKKLVELFDGAQALGIELFLLDDGWFGTKHPRNHDRAGLGDWIVNPAKLPRGLGHLAEEARKRGLRFGIWIEPEMVNPASELHDQHPEWVVRQPARELELQRNQLVLDLTRPEVREFQLRMIDDLLTRSPGISYVKWDANRFITQPGSSFLPPDRQSNFAIDHVNALHALMAEVARRHPRVEMMLCSGGGGRIARCLA
jgi:alpha-galactosidase